MFGRLRKRVEVLEGKLLEKELPPICKDVYNISDYISLNCGNFTAERATEAFILCLMVVKKVITLEEACEIVTWTNRRHNI